MISLSETVTLDDHEDIVEIFRIEKGSMIRFLCIDSIIVVGLFFFMTPLLRTGPWGVGFFLITLGLCALSGWRAVLKWMGSLCLVTTARIIVIARKGFWIKEVKDVAYKEIVHGQYLKQGIINTVRNVGSVQCMLKSSTSPFVIERIVHPQHLLELIGKHTTFAVASPVPAAVPVPPTPVFSHQHIPSPEVVSESKKPLPVPDADDYWNHIQS